MRLTKTEAELIKALMAGLSIAAFARSRGRSPSTYARIANHLRNREGVETNIMLIAKFMKENRHD